MKTVNLEHPENPGHVVEVDQDREQVYLEQGWKPVKPSKSN